MRRRRLVTILLAALLARLAATAPTAAAYAEWNHAEWKYAEWNHAEWNYVALGDSYSSGLGSGNYDPASPGCYRSPDAYPQLWASSHVVGSFQFVACAGATTQDVLDQQLSALAMSTNLVTITIGGNDAGFASVVTTCTIGGESSCLDAIDTAEAYISSQLPGRLDAMYSAIRRRSPAAQVVVIGYPRLFDLTWFCYLGSERRSRLNEAADLLASVTSDRATSARFVFADVRPAFDGHGVCSSDAWLHGVAYPLNESYHPTATGQSDGYLPAVDAVTG